MKKIVLLIILGLATASMAMAQASNDVLGAHNGYGRGCVMCHTPHGGSFGNGTGATGNNADPNNGVIAQWGQNIAPYYNLSTAFSGDNVKKYPVTLPANALAGAHDANTVIMLCLSCHDGSIARVSMMRGTTVETLPIVGGNAPTLFGTTPGNSSSYYANEHPVGGYAVVGCGGGHNWDCAGGDTTAKGSGVTSIVTPGPAITMTGGASAAFLIDNPSSFWNNWTNTTTGTATTYASCVSAGSANCSTSNPLSSFTNTGTKNGVGCTTCHDQHSMTRYTNSTGSYSTMFFINGQYTPLAGGNAVAQFCRNCHGGESNEMNGLSGIPTL